MPDRNGTSLTVKLLSVVLALILWAFVTGERSAERRVTVPVRCINVAAGLTSAGAPPFVEVVVTGPRLPLALLRREGLTLDLDHSGSGEGVTVFSGAEQHLGLPQGLRVARMYPARIEVRLERSKH